MGRSRRSIGRSSATLLLAAAIGAVSNSLWTRTASAAETTITWTGTSSGLWSNTGNWSGGNDSTYGELLFSGSTNTTMTDDQSVSQNLLIWQGTSSWVLNQSGGSVISLFDFNGGQPKIENDSTGSLTINASITFASNNGSPANPFGEINAVNGNITFGAAGTLTVNGVSVNGIKLFGSAHTVTFNDNVNASGKWFGFTTGGSGNTVTIGGTFTSGEFYVMNGGVLNLAAGGTLNATAIRLGGDFNTTGNQDQTKKGVFNLASLTGGQSYTNVINSVSGNTSGALAVNSLNTSGTNTLSGHIALDAALAITQSAGGLLNITQVKGGDNTTGMDIKAQTITLTANGIINDSGTIYNSTGSGTLLMNGAGTLILSGSNTYTGPTSVGTGTLQVANVNALSGTSGITVSSGAVFDLNGQTLTGATPLTIDGTGLGSTGALINSSVTAVAFAGQIDASAAANHAFSIGGIGSITLSGEIGPGNTLNTLTKVGNNTLTISGTADNVNLAITANTGTVILAKTNSATAHAEGSGLTVAGATVQLAGTGGDQLYDGSTVTINSGKLDLNATSETINTLNGSGGTLTNTATGTSTLSVGGNATANLGSGNYAGVIQDGGSGKIVALTKASTGTLTLSGANAYTGGTTFAAGELESSGATALGNGTGTWTLSGGNLTADTANQSYSNPLTITGSNPYAGVQSITTNGVTLTLGGNIASNGNRFTVGGTGLTNVNGLISGTGDLLKQGSGTLALNAANTGWSATNTPTNTSTNIFMDLGTVILLNNNAAGATDGSSTGRIAMGASAANGNTVLAVASGVTVANPIDARFFTGFTGGKTITDSFTGSGSAGYSGAVTLHDTTTLLANSGTILTFSGAITVGTAGAPYSTEALNTLTLTSVGGFGAGPGLLINDGTQTGIVELTTHSTLSDETIVKSGTLQFNGSGTIDNSTIRAYGASTINIANTDIVGSVINPQAANVNAGLPAFTGKLSATNTSGTATFSGHIGFDSNVTFFSTNPGANLAFTNLRSGNLTTTGIDIKGHTLTLAGAGNLAISGTLYNSVNSGSVIMAGTGVAVLSASNSYTGTTTVNGNGILQVNVDSALGTAAGGTNVANGSELLLNTVNYATAEPLTIDGAGPIGEGALINNGPFVGSGGNSTFAGPITIGPDGATIFDAGATLTLTGGVVKNGVTATFLVLGKTIINGTGISGSSANSDLLVDGIETGGTLLLNASNTYNGPTTILANATLQLGASNVLPTSPRTDLTLGGTNITTGDTGPGTLDMQSFHDGVNSLTFNGAGGGGTVAFTLGTDASTRLAVTNNANLNYGAVAFNDAPDGTVGKYTLITAGTVVVGSIGGTAPTNYRINVVSGTNGEVDLIHEAAIGLAADATNPAHVHLVNQSVAVDVSNSAPANSDALNYQITSIAAPVFGTQNGTRSADAGAGFDVVTGTYTPAAGPTSITVNAANNGANPTTNGTQSVIISQIGYRYAAPSAHSPEPVNFGVVHVGDSVSQQLTIQNTAANDTFSEKLDASIGSPTTGITAAGSFGLLAPQAFDSTHLSVGVDTTSAGPRSGFATITLTSNGSGTSNLGTTPLASQTVAVNATVNYYAQPTFTHFSGAASVTPATPNQTAYTLDFGIVGHNTGTYTENLAILNYALSSFEDSLGGSFTLTGITHFGVGGTLGFVNFSGIASGSSYGSTGTSPTGLQLTFSSAQAINSYSDTLIFHPTSTNLSGTSTLGDVTLTIDGSIVQAGDNTQLLINSADTSDPTSGVSTKSLPFGDVLRNATLNNNSLSNQSLGKTGADATSYSLTLGGLATTTFVPGNIPSGAQTVSGQVALNTSNYAASATGTVTVVHNVNTTDGPGLGSQDGNDVFTATANIGMASVGTHTPNTNLNNATSYGNVLTAQVLANDPYGTGLTTGLSSKTTTNGTVVNGVLTGGKIVGTEAVLLAGISSGGNTVSMTWRDRADNEANPTQAYHPMLTSAQYLVSDVLKLSGMEKAGGQPIGDRIPTDVFAISVSYDPNLLPQVYTTNNEAQLAAGGGLYLGWLDTGVNPGNYDPTNNTTLFWRNAVSGNLGTNLMGFQTPESWATFFTANPDLSADLGAWSVDTTNHTVWAVLDHNSEFAVVVPEPTSLWLLGLGSLALLRRRKR